MNWKKHATNILSFGAQGRIENKIKERDKNVRQLYKRSEDLIDIRTDTNKKLKHLLNLKKQSYGNLLKVKALIKNFTLKDRDFLTKQLDTKSDISIKQIDSSISLGTSYLTGVSSSIATTGGVWALVASYGAASTGTVIGSLSGAASTNATLAWFGGGSIAAGGGGMSAGVLVLGGMAGIILLTAAGVFAHVKAGKVILKIEEDINKIIKEQDIVEDAIDKINLVEKRTDEITYVIKKESSIIDNEIEETIKLILPYGFISKNL